MKHFKVGSQLSLFNDGQVKRSFLSRWTKNPTTEIINKMRLQNIFNVPLNSFRNKKYREDEIGYISFMIHMDNRHNTNITKIKNRYFYD